jgi:hypothetical protein
MSFDNDLFRSLKAGLKDLTESERQTLQLLWRYPNMPLKYLPTKIKRKPSNDIWLRIGTLGRKKLWPLMPAHIKRAIPRVRRRGGREPFYSGLLVQLDRVVDKNRHIWTVFNLRSEAVRALQEHKVIRNQPYPPVAEFKLVDDEEVRSGLSTPAETKRINQSIIARRGQADFRRELLSVYEGRCVVTGCSETRILEAAHIVGFRSKGRYEAKNGLLLRADWHTLYDLGLWAIHPKEHRIELAPSVIDETLKRYEGKPIRPPRQSQHRPDRRGLDTHYRRFLKNL